MTRSRFTPRGGAFIVALLSATLLFQPTVATAATDSDGSIEVEQRTPASILHEASDPAARAASPEPGSAEGSVLPPTAWPNHGAENGLIHLTGATFVEGSDSSVRSSSFVVNLMAKDAPGAVIATDPLSPFSFYNLPTGREYYLVVSYGSRPVYVAEVPSPFFDDAAAYSTSRYEIAVVLPMLVKASGTIGPMTPAGFDYRSVNALRYDEKRGNYRHVDGVGTYDGQWSLGGLYPGTYVFQGGAPAETDHYSDGYYDGADYFEDATPLVLDPGAEVTDIDFTLAEFTWKVGRLSGPDRYATSVAISQAAFDAGLPVLYLASGANWPDALSAGPAAAAQGGGLLLTPPGELPEIVAEEIKALAPARIVVVGSSASVGDTIVDAVRELLPDASVERIGGRDRYETSRMIVADAFGVGPFETVFLATGRNFPDALSAGPIAGRLGVPVVLVDGAADSLDSETATALTALSISEVAVLGSTSSISAGIEQQLGSRLAQSTRRFDGSDRFETNTWLNNVYVHANDPYRALSFFANGYGFADALAGAAAAALFAAPIYLSGPDCVPGPVYRSLEARDWDRVVLLGGEPSLSRNIEEMVSCG